MTATPEAFAAALTAAGGNVAAACRAVGMSRANAYARADAARRAQLDPEAPPVKMSRTRAAREQPHG